MPPMSPETYRYSEHHLWVKRIGRVARIGLTDFGQAELGEVLSVELPDIDDELERNEPFGEIETERTTSELVMPVSGTVVAVNEDLEGEPTLVNEDPYGKGWLIEVELAAPEELDELMDDDEYEEFTGELAEEDEEDAAGRPARLLDEDDEEDDGEGG
ncbi:MAG TPA: glycine cleavage system protein GcvH [Thermodesulfobacteriota bacterium]|nr:glycine cleavage system protein GcvH [Thermodesulfobacteriota bacterium]